MTLKLTVWELRGKSKIITTVLRLQIIHLYNSTLTWCIWYNQAVLLLDDAHYKSDCILLAIFRKMLNKSYFKLLAYVPALPRLLVLHKTLQHFLWNIVNITKIQERCSAAWRVCCTSDTGVALTTSCGTCQVAHVSFMAKSYRFVLIFSYLYRCIVSYTKYRDALIYRCIISPLWYSAVVLTNVLTIRSSWGSLLFACSVQNVPKNLALHMALTCLRWPVMSCHSYFDPVTVSEPYIAELVKLLAMWQTKCPVQKIYQKWKCLLKLCLLLHVSISLSVKKWLLPFNCVGTSPCAPYLDL